MSSVCSAVVHATAWSYGCFAELKAESQKLKANTKPLRLAESRKLKAKSKYRVVNGQIVELVSIGVNSWFLLPNGWNPATTYVVLYNWLAYRGLAPTAGAQPPLTRF